MVIKKDKSRQAFDREKLLNGILRHVKKGLYPLNNWKTG